MPHGKVVKLPVSNPPKNQTLQVIRQLVLHSRMLSRMSGQPGTTLGAYDMCALAEFMTGIAEKLAETLEGV